MNKHFDISVDALRPPPANMPILAILLVNIAMSALKNKVFFIDFSPCPAPCLKNPPGRFPFP
jgi:hypothetical protein